MAEGSSTKPVLVLVTGNKGKLAEVQQYLEPYAHVQAVQIDLPELQEATALTISRLKAIEAFRVVNKIPAGQPLASAKSRETFVPVLVDDTSLGFDCLGGLPGPYIKWFLSTVRLDGLIRMTGGFAVPGDASQSHRLAKASCVFSYCYGVDAVNGEALVEQFEGICPGKIVNAARGALGFGWDPIFEPLEQQTVGCAKTFAEMTVEEKNTISHRAKALALVKEYMAHH